MSPSSTSNPLFALDLQFLPSLFSQSCITKCKCKCKRPYHSSSYVVLFCFYQISWDHKITQAGKDLRKSVSVSLSVQSRTALESDQVVQDLILSCVENLQGWKWHNLCVESSSGKSLYLESPCPVPSMWEPCNQPWMLEDSPGRVTAATKMSSTDKTLHSFCSNLDSAYK